MIAKVCTLTDDGPHSVPEALGIGADDLDATLASYGGMLTPSRDAMAREELARVEATRENLPAELADARSGMEALQSVSCAH